MKKIVQSIKRRLCCHSYWSQECRIENGIITTKRKCQDCGKSLPVMEFLTPSQKIDYLKSGKNMMIPEESFYYKRNE